MIKYFTTITIVFVGIIFFSCATAPPPRIEDNRYINPEYEFMMDFPDGWEVTETMPDFIKKGVSIFDRQEFMLMFTNLKTMGFIGVFCDSLWYDLPTVAWSWDDSIAEHMRNHYKEIEESIKSDLKKSLKKEYKDDLLKFSHYVPYGFSDCDGSCLVGSISASFKIKEVTYNIEVRERIHACNEDDTCDVRIFLLSKGDSFEKNKKVFEFIHRSIETISKDYKKMF